MFKFSPIAALLLSLYLPKGLSQYLAPLALMGVLYQSRKSICNFFLQKIVLIMFLAPALIVALFLTPPDVLRLISFLVLIVAFPYGLIQFKGLSRVAITCFIYAFVFQVGILLDISIFEEFRTKYYPAEITTWTQGDFEASDFGFRFVRAAGLFYNPNVAALMSLFPYLIYAISTKPRFSGKLHLALMTMAGISLVLAGSRTYIFAFLLIIVFNIFKTKKSKVIILLAASIALSNYIYEYIFQDFSDASGSVNIKNQILFDYVISTLANDGGWFSILFGGEYGIQFDNDVGYILGGWGLTGLITVIASSILFIAKVRVSRTILPFILITMIGNSLFFGLLTAPLMVCLCIYLARVESEGLSMRGV